MTDYRDEQANELEALQAIYPDEYEELSNDPGEFNILIIPDEQDDDETYEMKLHVKYTPTYPDELPEYSLELTESQLDQEDYDLILSKITAAAEEALGMGMVFSMASIAKEALSEVIVNNKLRREKEAEEKAQKIIEEEERIKEGTRVNVDNFNKWKTAFDAEMAEKERLEKGLKLREDPKLSKPTGRQLFEKDHSLAKSDAQFMEEGDVSVDVDLFDREENISDDEEEENDVLRNIRSSD